MLAKKRLPAADVRLRRAPLGAPRRRGAPNRCRRKGTHSGPRGRPEARLSGQGTNAVGEAPTPPQPGPFLVIGMGERIVSGGKHPPVGTSVLEWQTAN